MQVSLAGLLICAGILVSVYYCRGSLITCLMASLSFGATSIVTLGSLGGSSPLIYTVFAALLLAYATAYRSIWRYLGVVFGRIYATWVVCVMMAYAVIGAMLYPRLFAGQTSAFVPSRIRAGVFEVPLEPVSGNVSQTGYLVLGGLTFLSVCIVLVATQRLDDVRRGFFAWCGLHTGMGLIDLAAKVTGAGDVLGPIRSASYAMLTDAREAGFSRIAGPYSEASAFAAVSLSCLAFTFTYWRRTNSRLALSLALALLLLLLLSTSTTAYVGLAILGIPVALSILRSFLARRLTTAEVLLLLLFVLCVLAALAVSAYDAGFFDPFARLIDTAVVNKASSASGQERAYWNYKSLQSFFDTGGLGIGVGSSRASSWLIAVLSQMGIVGAVTMAALIVVLARGAGKTQRKANWSQDEALVASVRACALAGIVAASLVSGSADPGIVFFVSLAVVSVSRSERVHGRYGSRVGGAVPQSG